MNKNRKPLLKTGQTEQSSFIDSDGNQGHRRLWWGCHSPGQVASDQGDGQDPQQLKELWQWLRDLNEVKTRRKENYGKKYEKNKFNWLCLCWIIIGQDLYLYRQ
jgi:hypothetical protein